MDAKINIPKEVRKEIEDFAAEVERRSRDNIDENGFKHFRLQQGIYGQRQSGDAQMVRTKLPLGQINSEKLNCLADFGDKYANGILHITTRQDVQFHFVDLDKVPEGLELLAEGGITTREACGNTVRNVTACHKSGTCANEAFDVSPYARAVSNYLLRHSSTQSLPRKFKISFGGCNGCGVAPIHDIGFSGVIREENGKQVRGFKILFGGGLGSSPHAAEPLTDFIPTNQVLRLAEALINVFNKYGDGKNRNKARFKFVLDKHGVDKVKGYYDEEFAALEGKQYEDIEPTDDIVPAISDFTPNLEFDSDPEFHNWKNRNTYSQKQAGFFNIHIKLHLGDLESEKARVISKAASDYAAGIIVTTINQNLMIPWVKETAMGAIYGELKKIGLNKAGTEELKDITCCPGSETCNLGITASRGLATALSEEFEKNYTASKELDSISIKMSGCPNSCGQHHIASIGFHGGAKKINGILAPHYEVMMGGRLNEDQVTFGTSVIKIPAKNVPEAVRIATDAYKKEKADGESFVDFFDRKGKAYFAKMLDPLKGLAPIEEDPHAYIDYGSTDTYSLEDRGQGECAGPLTDMISDNILAAERSVFQGKLALEKDDFDGALENANRSIIAAANGLLITEGMDFQDPKETLEKFQALIIDAGIVSEEFSGILKRYLENSQSIDKSKAETQIAEASSLVAECKKAYNKLQTDKSLRIRVGSA